MSHQDARLHAERIVGTLGEFARARRAHVDITQDYGFAYRVQNAFKTILDEFNEEADKKKIYQALRKEIKRMAPAHFPRDIEKTILDILEHESPYHGIAEKITAYIPAKLKANFVFQFMIALLKISVRMWSDLDRYHPGYRNLAKSWFWLQTGLLLLAGVFIVLPILMTVLLIDKVFTYVQNLFYSLAIGSNFKLKLNALVANPDPIEALRPILGDASVDRLLAKSNQEMNDVYMNIFLSELTSNMALEEIDQLTQAGVNQLAIQQGAAGATSLIGNEAINRAMLIDSIPFLSTRIALHHIWAKMKDPGFLRNDRSLFQRACSLAYFLALPVIAPMGLLGGLITDILKKVIGYANAGILLGYGALFDLPLFLFNAPVYLFYDLPLAASRKIAGLFRRDAADQAAAVSNEYAEIPNAAELIEAPTLLGAGAYQGHQLSAPTTTTKSYKEDVTLFDAPRYMM